MILSQILIMATNLCVHVFCTVSPFQSEIVRENTLPPKPLVLDPETCPPPFIKGHLCFGCWETMSKNMRIPLIKRGIRRLAFFEEDDIMKVFEQLKTYFKERKIYAHEDPLEFARFWIKVYSKINCNGPELIVNNEGTPFVRLTAAPNPEFDYSHEIDGGGYGGGGGN